MSHNNLQLLKGDPDDPLNQTLLEILNEAPLINLGFGKELEYILQFLYENTNYNVVFIAQVSKLDTDSLKLILCWTFIDHNGIQVEIGRIIEYDDRVRKIFETHCEVFFENSSRISEYVGIGDERYYNLVGERFVVKSSCGLATIEKRIKTDKLSGNLRFSSVNNSVTDTEVLAWASIDRYVCPTIKQLLCYNLFSVFKRKWYPSEQMYCTLV